MPLKHRQWLYHPEKDARIFEVGEEPGPGWVDTPAKFDNPSTEAVKPEDPPASTFFTEPADPQVEMMGKPISEGEDMLGKVVKDSADDDTMPSVMSMTKEQIIQLAQEKGIDIDLDDHFFSMRAQVIKALSEE